MARLKEFAALLAATAIFMPKALAQPTSARSNRCRGEDLYAGLDVPNALISHVEAQVVPSSPAYCNVTVRHGHPAFNDSITTTIALPLTGWDKRFQGIGGSGWAASSAPASLLPAIKSASTAGNTDAGHGLDSRSTDRWPLARRTGISSATSRTAPSPSRRAMRTGAGARPADARGW